MFSREININILPGAVLIFGKYRLDPLHDHLQLAGVVRGHGGEPAAGEQRVAQGEDFVGVGPYLVDRALQRL